MIRTFLQSDIEQVLNIWLKASIVSHDFVEQSFWESKVSDMRERYLPDSEIYVYEENKLIVGYISLHKNCLAGIFVLPKEQGRGIGKQLLNKAKELRQSLNLTVYKKNQSSIVFYKKCGFKIEGEKIDEHTGHPELIMTYKL